MSAIHIEQHNVVVDDDNFNENDDDFIIPSGVLMPPPPLQQPPKKKQLQLPTKPVVLRRSSRLRKRSLSECMSTDALANKEDNAEIPMQAKRAKPMPRRLPGELDNE